MTPPRTEADLDADETLAVAREVLETEAMAVHALISRLDGGFVEAVRVILNATGRVVVSGIGKSGHVARKIASTLASTGTPAFFVHPAEASHGDLGMIQPDDVVLALSNSGESDELLLIMPLLKRHGAKLIAMTGNARSSLARQANIHLDAAVEREAGPLGLAPTSSTTAALALGDALALALLKARGFGANDFARSHPGGSLGHKLLVRVADVMHDGQALPRVTDDTLLPDALTVITSGGLGVAVVMDSTDQLLGIFTDGDLRRVIAKGLDIRKVQVGKVMVLTPHTIGPDQLAAEALKYMEQYRINGLIVVDGDSKVVGAFNMHDLFRAGVV
ncbi:MAG: KpsF/GutQ family sugar-phosphate isomerase [Candidatus Accumulibacter meliphilus]|jgi:arabinose-5-phosphate isomerase|uniref:KpsF/GutQ family sugar-phosphate isomerase n=1 Tax=Candidatus Accumulibacter meliphilus TaxID=2211374 RepID=UPI002FC359D2